MERSPERRVGDTAPPLPQAEPASPGQPVRVCIASADLVGPVRNGGVGTAFTALAVALAEAGHRVTLLYVGGDFCENGTLDHWVRHYRSRNIEFVPLPAIRTPRIHASHAVIKAYETYEWLKNNDRFDVIHFSEWLGNGYFALLARRQNLHFRETSICVTTHGPSLWHRLNNADFICRPDDLELDFLERQSVAAADVVVSPSRYLLRWMEHHGWNLPERTYVQQYVMPHQARPAPAADDAATRPVSELVFFGRLEVRKGLALFCDALDRLAERHPRDASPLAERRLAFLGKVAQIDGRPADRYIRERAERWPWRPEILTDLDQEGAMRYLEQEGRLAVIPSLADNLPNTVLECLGGRIPFIAAASGGIPEMIAPGDLARTCFELRPLALAERLEELLRDGARPARAAVDAGRNERAWVAWHAGPATSTATAPALAAGADTRPLVSVCLPHFDRPVCLRRALDSLRAQDYPNFEVIVVDDGSTQPETLAYLSEVEGQLARRGWRLIRQPNRYPGAARNNAARHARGEWLLFMDDDNLAKSHELSTLVGAALHGGADILTCFSDVIISNEPIEPIGAPDVRWICLGPAVAAGVFRNVFGDTNALVRRRVFLELGGFHEIYGVGLEDWELFARAALRGYRLSVVPEALFRYRVSDEGVNVKTPLHRNMLQVLEPYRDALPPSLGGLLLLAQGMKLFNDQLLRAQQQPDETGSLLRAGRLLAAQGDTTTAVKLYSMAMQLARESKNGDAALEALLGSAEAFVQSGQHDMARQSLQAAEKVAGQIRDTTILEVVQTTLAKLELTAAGSL